MCPLCGNPLVVRSGKYGKFVACSNYPNCKYVKKKEKQVVEICKCPECDGMIVEKTTKRVRYFTDVITILNVNMLRGISQNRYLFYKNVDKIKLR